jgi:predicted HicB family RNase H-like nuclease
MKHKREGKPMKATILRLDPETHKSLRIAAIEAEISMNDAINQAVELWLKERRKAGKEGKR